MTLSVDGTGGNAKPARAPAADALGANRSCLDSKCAIRCPEDERMRMSRENALNLTLSGLRFVPYVSYIYVSDIDMKAMRRTGSASNPVNGKIAKRTPVSLLNTDA
jgi:hypothetical protein